MSRPALPPPEHHLDRLQTARAKHAYAVETNRQAEEMWRYVFPPWRWPEWLRRYREVKRRLAVFDAWPPTEREGDARRTQA